MPTAVGRFFEQLRDRNTWPRRSWYPPERYTTIDPKSEEWKKESTELQSLIKKTVLTTVGFSAFCLLALAAPDASILDAKSKVKIALLNIDIDYTSFLYVGPMLIIALSLYIHILLAEWFEKLKPHAKDAGSVDIYTMSPDIFNIQLYRFAGIIYNFLFYWMPIFVLTCFALKWIPQPRYELGMAFSTFLSSIVIPVLIWIKIRRCPDSRRLLKNLFSWVVFGMTPLYFSLLCFFPEDLPRDISGMKLYGVDFHRQDLTNVFLPFADLRKANLQDATLQGAYLQRAYLQGANLQGATLQGANLQRAKLEATNLQGAYLQGARLQRAELQGANLRGANLQRAYLKATILQGANLKETNLQDAELQGVILQDANLQGVNLQGVNLQGANLEATNLQGANLQGANLQGANLRGTKLCGASLNKATLAEATLEGADLRQTDLSEAILKVSREQLATAYYVKKPPDLQLIGMDSDVSETLSKMARKNSTERDDQVKEKKICETPLADPKKLDTLFLDDWVALAKTHFEASNSLAEEMLKVAMKVDPNHVGAVFQLGRLWHIQAPKVKTDSPAQLYQKVMDHYQNVIKQYDKAIAIAEKAKADGTRKEQLAQAYYNLGAAYMKKGELAKKMGEYDYMNGEYDKAIDVLMKWQRLFDTSDDKVLANLGISHLNKVPSDTSKARYFLEQAIDMNPNNDVAKNAINVVKTLEMKLGR